MAAKKENELSFEENLEKLESIVKKLESGEVPLDNAITEFTEAMKLAKLCDEKLKRQRIIFAFLIDKLLSY